VAYDDDDSVIYLLDSEKRIVRCNREWDRFALANGGGEAVSSKVIGTGIMTVVPPHLRAFYCAAYDNVQRHQRPWWHTFECSSPMQARIFHMRILPCEDGGLLIINTLIGSADLGLSAPIAVSDYADSEGTVIMCSHCRRVRRRSEPRAWDWLPELLIGSRLLVTFDLCEFCTAYHYHVR
jgi:hypothetical protein